MQLTNNNENFFKTNILDFLRCENLIVVSRFVLKGPCYNPLDVMNCLMTRRGYKVTSEFVEYILDLPCKWTRSKDFTSNWFKVARFGQKKV